MVVKVEVDNFVDAPRGRTDCWDLLGLEEPY